MSPMSPKNGGAGEGSFPRLKTIPTAKPVRSASVIAPMVGIPVCKLCLLTFEVRTAIMLRYAGSHSTLAFGATK